MSVFVGLDIGGTKLMVASADATGNVIQREREPTPEGLEDGLSVLHAMIGSVSAGEEISGIGAAIGGPLDWENGVVSPLHQPEWRDVPLRAIMEKRWGCPFSVDVDTNIAALGEYHLFGQKLNRFMYVTVSTGVGGGFIVNGSIYRGMKGGHPEVGHQTVPSTCSYPELVSCECGASDCLEALVSGNGIRRVYGKPAEELSEPEWDEVTYNLGQGLRNIAALYLPDIIVLGGSVALGGGEKMLKGIRAVMRDYLKIVPVPEVRLSKLGHDTALLGALIAARLGIH